MLPVQKTPTISQPSFTPHFLLQIWLSDDSSLCGDSRFRLKNYVTMTICLMSNSRKCINQCTLKASLNETNFPFHQMISTLFMRWFTSVNYNCCHHGDGVMADAALRYYLPYIVIYASHVWWSGHVIDLQAGLHPLYTGSRYWHACVHTVPTRLSDTHI